MQAGDSKLVEYKRKQRGIIALSLLYFPFCFNSILLSADSLRLRGDKLDCLMSKALIADFHYTLLDGRLPTQFSWAKMD